MPTQVPTPESAEPTAVPSSSAALSADDAGARAGEAPRRKNKSMAPMVIVVAVVAIGLAVVGTSTSGGAGMYNYSLEQLATAGVDTAGRDIKVAGKVAKGSVRGEPASKTFRFDLEDGQGHKLTIAYDRLLPDPFEEGRDAIVQGRLQDGTLVASNLTVKCPSRYEDGGKTLSEADQKRYYQEEYKKHKAANPGQPAAAPAQP
jgi:cytochrome c-type biogenesis protein CcmE